MRTDIAGGKDSFAFFAPLKFITAMLFATFGHFMTHFLVGLGLENTLLKTPFLRYLGYNEGVLVEMFFIFSGILFYYVYRPRILNGLSLDKFITGRVVRLYPTIAVTSVYMYCANAFLYMRTGTQWPDASLSLWDLCSDILFAGRESIGVTHMLNSVAWYISVLMLCYGMAYILTLISQKLDSVLIYAAPVFVALIMWYAAPESTKFVCNQRGMVAFFVGVLLGRVLEFERHLTRRQQRVLRVALAVELLLIVRSQISILQPELTGHFNCFYTFLVFPELIMLLYGVKWVERVCSTKIVQWGGVISYGIYMWHLPMYLTFHLLITFGVLEIDVYSAAFFVLRSVTIVLLATLSYILIEKKLTARIRRLIAQVTKPEAGSASR